MRIISAAKVQKKTHTNKRFCQIITFYANFLMNLLYSLVIFIEYVNKPSLLFQGISPPILSVRSFHSRLLQGV